MYHGSSRQSRTGLAVAERKELERKIRESSRRLSGASLAYFFRGSSAPRSLSASDPKLCACVAPERAA